jgi:ketosteroid isomerase-like protein
MTRFNLTRQTAMTFKKIICMSALAACSAGAAAQQLPSVQLPPELDRVLRDYEKHWSANKPADVAALFTADGMALPNGSPPAVGAAQIAAAYARHAGKPLALRAMHYTASADMAYIIGGFASAAGAPDGGKFVLVLKKGADGKWMIAADMDNMNAMPRRAPAPAAPQGQP